MPPALRSAIGSCLAPDPGDRPSIAELMALFDLMVEDARDVALRRLRRRIRW